jgi:hypothetical protein
MYKIIRKRTKNWLNQLNKSGDLNKRIKQIHVG